jgi:type IV pilus assembly protein PilM
MARAQAERVLTRRLKRTHPSTDRAPVFKKRSSKNAAAVGLELDPGHVAAAEVSVNGSVTLMRGAMAPLRPGIVRDGEVADAAGLAETLRGLFDEHDLPRRVRLGIANQRIVVRTLDLPPLDDDKAVAAAVKVQAPDHIPMPMDEAVIDWQSLGIVQTPRGPRSRVVVVAVRREVVDRLVGVAREAGLELAGIDLSAFGMVRALGAREGGARLYINVAGLTNVAVANGSGCLFTRAAAGGLEDLAHTLSERRGLTREHARQWMQHVGLVAPLEGVEGDPDLVTATRAVLEDGVHQLADTVRNSLNFYRTQESAEAVESGVLTGPTVEIPGFAERLSELLKLPLEPATVAAHDEVGDLAHLTVAAGLAVESVA